MTKDILAVCMIGAGSSWGRGQTVEQAIGECKRELLGCWGSIYKLDGVEVVISIYDVTGNDEIHMDYHGLSGDNEEAHPIILIEHRDVILKDKRRKA